MRKKYIRRPGGFEAEPYVAGLEHGCLNETVCLQFKNGECHSACMVRRPYVNTEHKGRCPVGYDSMLVYAGDKIALVVNKKQFEKMFEEEVAKGAESDTAKDAGLRTMKATPS